MHLTLEAQTCHTRHTHTESIGLFVGQHLLICYNMHRANYLDILNEGTIIHLTVGTFSVSIQYATFVQPLALSQVLRSCKIWNQDC